MCHCTWQASVHREVCERTRFSKVMVDGAHAEIDRLSVAVAGRMLSAVTPGGEIVIGNFAVGDPSQAYMELGGWFLHHRTADELKVLLIWLLPSAKTLSSTVCTEST